MSDTKECKCPLFPAYSPGSFGSGSSHETRLQDDWRREHGDHQWAKDRDALVAEVGPRIDSVMQGKSPREWRMLVQALSALCVLMMLAASSARAAEDHVMRVVFLQARAATDQLRLENKDLVNGTWEPDDVNCAVVHVALKLIERYLAGETGRLPGMPTREELAIVRAYLELNKEKRCRPPPGSSANKGLAFVQAVEARHSGDGTLNREALSRLWEWAKAPEGQEALRRAANTAAVMSSGPLAPALVPMLEFPAAGGVLTPAIAQ